MEFEVLKKHIMGPMLFSDMVQWVSRWERQKRLFGRKKKSRPHDIEMLLE